MSMLQVNVYLRGNILPLQDRYGLGLYKFQIEGVLKSKKSGIFQKISGRPYMFVILTSFIIKTTYNVLITCKADMEKLSSSLAVLAGNSRKKA